MATGFSDAQALAAIHRVRDHYLDETRISRGSGFVQLKRPQDSSPSSVIALEVNLAGWLAELLAQRPDSYAVKASAGQANRAYTFIPYATALRAKVTQKPTQGIYAVLLFHQQMESLWLSLNQGVEHYFRRYGSKKMSAALRQSAAVLGRNLQAPGFSTGPIGLGATSDFGQAYETGAILSKRYDLATFDMATLQALKNDLGTLLGIYEGIDLLIAQDPSIAGMANKFADDEELFQDEANKIASNNSQPPPDKAKAPPKRKPRAGSAGYERDAKEAAYALVRAGHKCEVDPTHGTFVSAATKQPYVEAHHLIPLSAQQHFPAASLDVQANIVALCPNCHRLIHHAVSKNRDTLISVLHGLRAQRLQSVGLITTPTALAKYY